MGTRKGKTFGDMLRCVSSDSVVRVDIVVHQVRGRSEYSPPYHMGLWNLFSISTK